MSRRQFTHLPLLLVVVALTIPAALAALLLRVTFALIRYLHRIYVPGQYVDDDGPCVCGCPADMFDGHVCEDFEPIVCTIPTDEHGWTELPGGFSGHVPCNGWPRIDCPVHPDSEFAERPGQKLAVMDVEVVRVAGRIVCEACGKEYRDHPSDPANPWPTFVLLCDGTHAKC